MFPIYEQGRGSGIGLDFNSFHDRFEAICREHLQAERAKAFAFIFYNFRDRNLRLILKNNGVFAKLDRLSGVQLSMFYLDTGGKKAIVRFNAEFLSKLRRHR
jgi:hypothetical protein